MTTILAGAMTRELATTTRAISTRAKHASVVGACGDRTSTDLTSVSVVQTPPSGYPGERRLRSGCRRSRGPRKEKRHQSVVGSLRSRLSAFRYQCPGTAVCQPLQRSGSVCGCCRATRSPDRAAVCAARSAPPGCVDTEDRQREDDRVSFRCRRLSRRRRKRVSTATTVVSGAAC